MMKKVLKKIWVPVLTVAVFLLYMVNFSPSKEFFSSMAIRSQITDGTYAGDTGFIYDQQAKRQMDSIQRIQTIQKNNLRGFGSGWNAPFSVLKVTDDLSDFSESTSSVYVNLPDFYLVGDNVFYLKEGKYYLHKFERHYTSRSKYSSSYQLIDKGVQEIPVRYRVNVDAGSKPDPFSMKGLLVPIKKEHVWFYTIMSYVPIGIHLFLGLFAFLVLPIRVLQNIARGRPFIQENILFMNFMVVALIILGILPSLAAGAAKLLYFKIIPPEFSFSVADSLRDKKDIFLAALIIFLIATAFKKGYKLQQEQDLTV